MTETFGPHPPDSDTFHTTSGLKKGVIHLIDDGTLDTVLACSNCREEFRGHFDPQDPAEETEDAYDAFVEDFIAETAAEHVCDDTEGV